MDTLKTCTKAELIHLVQERNAIINALRLELSIARADGARSGARASITPGHIAYREQCERARQEAMRSGRAVKVDAIKTGATS